MSVLTNVKRPIAAVASILALMGASLFVSVQPAAAAPSLVASIVCPIDLPLPGGPVADDDAYATPQNTPLLVGAPGVLANDTGVIILLGPPLSGTPDHGFVLFNNLDGSFFYTPSPGYTGPDSFVYIAVGLLGVVDCGTVSITVGSPPGGGSPGSPQS